VRLKGGTGPQLVDKDDLPAMEEAGMIEAYYGEDMQELKSKGAGSGDTANKQPEANDQAQ
jgi:hypothetical protein